MLFASAGGFLEDQKGAKARTVDVLGRQLHDERASELGRGRREEDELQLNLGVRRENESIFLLQPKRRKEGRTRVMAAADGGNREERT